MILVDGCEVYVEPAPELPLVWFRIVAPLGAANDPVGKEGLARTAAMLARRGTQSRNRAKLDETLDSLGASLSVSASRDSMTLSAVCLTRYFDRTLDIAAEIIAAPRMEPGEFDKLLRESLAELDELRDDDGDLAARFFAHLVAPGYRYARTPLGTEASLASLDLSSVRAAYSARFAHQPNESKPGIIFGFAGAMDDTRAERAVRMVLSGLSASVTTAESPAPAALNEPLESPPDIASERRIFLVDKPERMQSQIRIGHLAPRYADDDFRALTVAETIFGGTFSSRLMQAIRVKRGWSYGASFHIARARGPLWLQSSLAPAAETTADAATLVMSLYSALVHKGVSDAEFDFARSHLLGSLPFYRATAPQRMHLALRNRSFGLPATFHDQLERSLRKLAVDDVNRAIERHLHPQSATTVVVATADRVAGSLARAGLGELATLPYDTY